MRATSSRSLTSPLIWSACWSMMWKNWTISAGPKPPPPPSTVAAEPLMEVRGARSSWLTIPRKSARSRSCSSRGVRSWRVTTKDCNCPSPERMGVALTSTLTLRPSGTRSAISSARTVSPAFSSSTRVKSRREYSRPSERTQVTTSSRSSAGRSASRRPSTMRSASRFTDAISPVRPSKTTTPTGEVLTRVSRSDRARCSSRWAPALAMTRAAWAANITRVSWSS